MKITDQDFLQMYSAASNYTDQLNQENREAINYYLRNPRGDEKPNESTTVSSDCFDVVESDMPSITRSLLGGGNIMEFKADNADNKAEILEAAQKTKLANKVLLGHDGSFKTLYDWFKAAGIYTFSALTYYPEETERRQIEVFEGITRIELDAILQAFEKDDKVLRVDVETDIDEDAGENDVYDVEVHIWRESQEYVFKYIQPDKFLISRGGPTIDDCSFVGHIESYRKGELIELGIDKDLVEGLVSYGGSTFYADQSSNASNNSIITDIQAAAIGSDNTGEAAPQWYLEEVEVVIACVLGATDKGAPERRRIMWAGNTIIKDDPFDHVNYAVLSAYPLPGQVIGMSRVGITMHSQDQKTFVQRGLFNNMAQVNKPMTAININKDSGSVNQDDFKNRRANGIVRVNGDPSLSIMPLGSPSIAADALQLIQYIDFNRAQTTGALMASQGLNKDDLYNETATRFNGVSEEGAAKLENVLRIYAETGIKKLYRGIEWMLKHYQDSMVEETILGEQIAYSPADWRYDSSLASSVGLAASDTNELIENLGVIYNSQKELKMMGSPIVDDEKLYGTLTRILKAMNVHDNSAFFNDPKQPDQLLKAQNEQLTQLVSQMQQQLQSSSIAEASLKIEELRGQVSILKDQNKSSIDVAKLQESKRQFDIESAQKANANRANNAIKITELELNNNKQLPGGLDE